MRRSCRSVSSGGATARYFRSASIRSKIVRVDQALGLELAVAATDVVLGRLVEVGEHVLDHPQRLAPVEGRGPRQMINKFVVHPVDPGVPAAVSQESCPISGRAARLNVSYGWPVRALSIRRPASRCLSATQLLDAMDIPRMGVPEKLAERMSMAEQHEYLRAKFSRRNDDQRRRRHPRRRRGRRLRARQAGRTGRRSRTAGHPGRLERREGRRRPRRPLRPPPRLRQRPAHRDARSPGRSRSR